MENLPENLTDKYSFFDNEYLLTKEMCAEAEISRIDTGLIIAWILFTFMLFMMMPFAPAMINDYFSAPSMGTILSLSGGVGITILPSFAAVILLIRVFPQKAGEKRFQEQLQLVPSEKRRLCFYNEYVEVTGKFRKKLSYTELKRTGETRNLYLLYFKDNKIVYVPKDNFRKGTLRELKSFIGRRRTWGSKCYGVIRWLPVLFFLLVCCRGIWEG